MTIASATSPAGERTRFAPSPTGLLHLGHARAALLAWRAAQGGGHFLLRLEDIDPGRCRPEFARAIEADLAWLGLAWEGPVRVQSAHLAEYRAALDALAARGLLYPCFCTRAGIAREMAAAAAAPHASRGPLPGSPEGAPEGAPAALGATVYPGTCRRLSAAARASRLARGDPHALRLDMTAALACVPGPLHYLEQGHRPGQVTCDPGRFGDVVLGRRDAPASYHLCVTHDDAVQGVTLVTRGEDLREATDLHRLLQALLGWPAPRYAHHALLTDAAGRRLAKRDGAATLRALREAGLRPAEVLALAAGSSAAV